MRLCGLKVVWETGKKGRGRGHRVSLLFFIPRGNAISRIKKEIAHVLGNNTPFFSSPRTT
jgi:hypothetical protein